MPTDCQPKILPPRVNAQESGFVGAPKEGARPPAAGAASGASGESPTPIGLGEPGRAAAAALGCAVSCARTLGASVITRAPRTVLRASVTQRAHRMKPKDR